MFQKGYSLIEVMVVCAVGTVYIVVGYTWYVHLTQTVERDTRRNLHVQQLTTILGQYTKYEDIVGKDPTPLVATTSATINTTIFTDIDRVTSKVHVSVTGLQGSEMVQGERVFSRYGDVQNNAWCGVMTGTSVGFTQKDAITIPSANLTAIVPYDRYLIVSNDTATLSDPDIYVIDMVPTLHVVATLTTGPGISTLVASGRYLYAGNTPVASQLQIIDLQSPEHPVVVQEFKLPLPTATTSPPDPSVLAYQNGIIYMGTEKWNGPELQMIDVSDPLHPKSSFTAETNSMVQDIALDGYSIFVALSSDPQFAEYRVQESTLSRVWSFTPTGASVQEGKRINILPRLLTLGRTVGGFNIVTNHELFVMNRTNGSINLSTSTDIGSGIYGVVSSGTTILAAIGGGISYLGRVEDYTKSILPVGILALNEKPKSMTCTGNSLVILGQQSVAMITR